MRLWQRRGPDCYSLKTKKGLPKPLSKCQMATTIKLRELTPLVTMAQRLQTDSDLAQLASSKKRHQILRILFSD